MVEIVNVGICSSGKATSGGEKCMVELINQFSRLGYKQEIYLGFEGEGRDILPHSNLRLHVIERRKLKNRGKFFTLLAYFNIFLKSFFYVKKFNSESVIISHSDAWPDVVFAALLKRFNREAQWIAFNHMLLPESKYQTNPLLIRLYNYINQRAFFYFQKRSDLLVLVNEMYLNQVKKYNQNVLIVKYGREFKADKIRTFEEREIDLCFIGRFYPQKGVSEIPEICQELSKIWNGGKLKFIFIGTENRMSEDLKRRLAPMASHFEFEFLGFKAGFEKYDLLSKSKVFVFPSFFESFGIVYLDAISVGTPVVEYDLECFKAHRYGVIKVPFRNNKVFAQRIDSLLRDRELYNKQSTEGFQYSNNFSWQETAETLIGYFCTTPMQVES
ncbi:MAG: glycosyltransferase family 4 protein [Deltaproteobacteria bacterium]|nr:glycosyltransferase family 4 protein [Deltaproteobacteria bacterium]